MQLPTVAAAPAPASRSAAAAGSPRGFARAPGWLESRRFDLMLIGGTAAIALLSGAVVLARPELFALVLFLDLWVLGFHHVVSTFTRLAFDAESFQRHRFLVLGLPVLVLLGVIGLVVTVGLWALPTLYFYWQWFHYTRQSYGVGQIYRRKAADAAVPNAALTKAAIYLLPLAGILYRSSQSPEKFLGLELRVIPTPAPVLYAALAAAGVALIWWSAVQLRAYWQGRLPLAHSLYMLSHLTIFAVGYLLIADLNHGWLVLNVWHNAQYILVVWLFNSNRFKGGVQPQHRFLSTLSQRRNTLIYLGLCLAISTAAYGALTSFFAVASISAVTAGPSGVPDDQLPSLHRGRRDLEGAEAAGAGAPRRGGLSGGEGGGPVGRKAVVTGPRTGGL